MEINHKMLDWDSNFMGFPVGRIEIDSEIDANILQRIIDLSANYKLCYLVSSKEITTSTQQIDNRFFLADIKLTFGFDLDKVQLKAEYDEGGFITLTEEVPGLMKLVLLSGKYSRYKLDPSFDKNIFKDLYGEWLRKSLSGQLAEVVTGYYINGQIVGFITIARNQQQVSIGLVSVDEDYQGLGIGKKLMQFTLQYAAKTNARHLKVETQSMNTAACGLYTSMGLKEIERLYIYHIWS